MLRSSSTSAMVLPWARSFWGTAAGSGGVAFMQLASQASMAALRPDWGASLSPIVPKGAGVKDLVQWLTRDGASPTLDFRRSQEIAGFEAHQDTLQLARHAHGVAALSYDLDLTHDLPAQHRDAAVAGDEVFLGVERDRALAHLAFEVAGELLVLGLGHLAPGLAVEARARGAEARPVAAHAPRHIDTEVRVVDRQDPADLLAALIVLDARVRHHAQGRQHHLGDAVMHRAVRQPPILRAPQAARRRHEIHLGHDRHLRDELRAAEAAVQDRHVERVHDVLEMLQPVARHQRPAAAADAAIVGLQFLVVGKFLEDVVARQHRPPVRRAEIGEDQTVPLFEGIPRLAHAVAVTSALGLAGLVEAAALHVEQPAVIAAADAVLLAAPVIERGAAVAATRIKQSRSPRAVAEQDQVFAEYAERTRPQSGIGSKPDRVPIAAQPFAGGRAATDLGQRGVEAGLRQAVGGTRVRIHGVASLPVYGVARVYRVTRPTPRCVLIDLHDEQPRVAS